MKEDVRLVMEPGSSKIVASCENKYDIMPHFKWRSVHCVNCQGSKGLWHILYTKWSIK
jgi:hypothetical protein